ncbi:hypothetical protein GETHLI_19090 [Geothrix limicola]|uniref:Uncharacterized protein n=1 Tax=Geothrix limicola TaxID=2927978 RepID=A0ABQ5QFH7_9BACT|nr:hypothetical protein GETHLI_19090 [Geothrix limicola]
MNHVEILRPTLTKNPQSPHPGLDARAEEVQPLQVRTSGRKAADLSPHESRHDTAPKPAPKLNAREKQPAAPQQGPSQLRPGKPPVEPNKT